MPTIYEGLGLEELVDGIMSVLRTKLNDQLDNQAAKWAPLDEARATEMGVAYIPIELEHVKPSSYHTGNIPSLVRDDLPLDDYPYVAITTEDVAPDAEDASQDHKNVFRDVISIHAIAKSSKEEGPEFCFRRACRMTEAIYAVILGDRRLRQRLQGTSNPQRSRVSEPFIFNPEGIEDRDWFWQAAFSQYAVKNYGQFPEEV